MAQADQYWQANSVWLRWSTVRLPLFFLAVLLLSAILPWRFHALTAIARFQQPPVAVVSAASFEATAIAPCSIASAFGTKLATMTKEASGDADPNTPGIQLPTELGGTTVMVNGQLAGLFFVSPMQVNFHVPCNTQPGNATIKVKSGDGTESSGTMEVRLVAPAIFAANSDGKGVPAAVLLRVKSNGMQMFESIFQCSSATGICSTKPIDPGPEGDRLFLILFLSGISRAPDPNMDGSVNENVHVVIGGAEITPVYAGPQGVLTGLDQINVEIPRNLAGRGRVNLAVAGNGFAASNVCNIEIGSQPGNAPPTISDFTPGTLTAGQKLTINGNEFSSNPAQMLVRICGVEAKMDQAASNQLMVTVPFGSCTSPVTVRASGGEGISQNPVAIRTSISGIVETTNRQPLSGATVKLSGTTMTTQTNREGLFILPDVPVGTAFVEVDGATVPATPAFPKMQFRIIVSAGQDNQFARPLSLQQPTGPSIILSGLNASSLDETTTSVPAPAAEWETEAALQTGEIRLELPPNVKARFPDGAISGAITLNRVENSRTPVNLPLGLYSVNIAQIAPFGVTLEPGGKLIFPNTDNLPAGSVVKLYRFDQTAGGPALGSFVEAGAATVNGNFIETAANAIIQTGYYFVAGVQPTTTVIGRVVDSDNTTPVRQALVRSRGQEAFTDGNGAFILRFVPTKAASDPINVEGSFVRPSGRVDRTERGNIAVVVNGITKVTPDLVLPSEASNRPPVIICPSELTVNASGNRTLRSQWNISRWQSCLQHRPWLTNPSL